MYQGDKNENSKTGVYCRGVKGGEEGYHQGGDGSEKGNTPLYCIAASLFSVFNVIYLTIILVLKNSLLNIFYHTFVKNASIFGILF